MDERKEDGKKTIVSIIGYIITSIVSIVVSFVVLPIITNIMSTADLGIATTFSTLKNIVTIICLLAISNSIDRIMLDVKGKEFEHLSSLLIFSNVFAVLVYIIYFIFRDWINNILGFSTEMMTLMFMMIIVINGSTIYTTYCNFKNKSKTIFIYNILASPVAQIISLLLVYFMGSHKYLGRIIGVDIFNILAGVAFTIFILYKGRMSVKKKYITGALTISIPLIPHLLSQVLLANSDLLMIKNLVGESEAGIYSMAYTISNVLYLVLIQLVKPWSPWVYRRMKNNEIDSIKGNSALLVSVTGFLAIGLFTVAPEAIRWFLNKDYLPAMNLIAPICTGIFFQIMYIFFYDIEYYYKKNKNIAIFSVIAALINILLNYICIQKFGYYAAAYTTLISYFILTVLHFIGMKFVEKRKIYDIKHFIFITIYILAITILNVLFIDNYILRYLLLVISFILMAIRHGKQGTEMAMAFVKEKWKKNEK